MFANVTRRTAATGLAAFGARGYAAKDHAS